ncbi:MAG: mannose-1-phosphate guanylyltransferase [Myxococcales bacterium]|nr:mannose-1-phosphate guanylyltransferase [Myxococcales bacterium]
MTKLYATIMAGGVGARFWPLSRRAHPKQLLPLGPTEEPLLRATVRRLGPLCPPSQVLIVTGADQAEATRAALPEVPPENILAEPLGRNTAPCVAWAAAHVRRRDPEGVMAVLPADHHIGNEQAYLSVLKRAVDAAAGGSSLVTVGLTPTRPETGYGYIEMGESIADGVHRVARFVEKPDLEKAKSFVEAGRFLWNSGMFFFRADRVLAEVQRQLPDLAQGIEALDAAAKTGTEAQEVERIYPTLPSISIDYGLMEKAEDVLVVPGSFGWSDLGSWTTAWELSEKDAGGNAAPAESVLVDSKNVYVRAGQGKAVAIIGMEDLVVVDTEDALLIMPRERAQDVRAIVDELKRRGDQRY